MARLASLPQARAESIVRALAVVPSRLLDGGAIAEWITPISSMFLHAGWLHLAGNVLFLLVFGPGVESRIGWRGLASVATCSAVAGSVAYALANPTSSLPLVGASGAIAGILGAHLVLDPQARITTLVPVGFVPVLASLPAAFVTAAWFGLQLASHVGPVVDGAQGVAWLSHIAGFLAGAVMCVPTALRRAPRATRAASRGGRARS